MTFVASAPGRCGIVGNPSDLYGGKVLSCSLSARATCRLTVGEDESLPEDRTLWDAAFEAFPVEGPCRVEWSTDIPRSSGLSGSTALLAATIACLQRARGEAVVANVEMAMRIREIERKKVLCGYQDALMITLGGLRIMDFAGKDRSIRPSANLEDHRSPPFPSYSSQPAWSGSAAPSMARWSIAGWRAIRASSKR